MWRHEEQGGLRPAIFRIRHRTRDPRRINSAIVRLPQCTPSAEGDGTDFVRDISPTRDRAGRSWAKSGSTGPPGKARSPRRSCHSVRTGCTRPTVPDRRPTVPDRSLEPVSSTRRQPSSVTAAVSSDHRRASGVMIVAGSGIAPTRQDVDDDIGRMDALGQRVKESSSLCEFLMVGGAAHSSPE